MVAPLLFGPEGQGLQVIKDGDLHPCSCPSLLSPKAKAVPATPAWVLRFVKQVAGVTCEFGGPRRPRGRTGSATSPVPPRWHNFYPGGNRRPQPATGGR